MADEKKLFKVTIDNITVEVEPGTSILQAARKIGGDVAPPAGPSGAKVASKASRH
jgi:NADH-quinone oxidoreductase subunit G